MKRLNAAGLALVMGAASLGANAVPCEPETCAALKAVALDYIDGWYDGNAARMKQSLHPQLVKRALGPAGNEGALDEMGADGLIFYTGKGIGATTDPARRRAEVTVLDVSGDMAAVKVVATDWVDYLQMGRFGANWKIVNVVWERHPPGK
ncbi:nuclear transport factor 2 family protein [Jeongeupia naejangsanensis]|uniref:Nuclear transport factor 2 family protein n=1 Tax=Jeongeupia naejangsanensis TaxID=613195 RepID=A0ABS2BG78_9NEIS|nr:nuclear transport factor 2 family protein [Jeongeupia naejangsanensis]MBM3114609.1 nuclear transport factor 2 family protein [Jeongeupia naejangsanensis]